LRDVVLWATALLFLLAALYTVTVRREVYEEARRIGVLEHRLREQRRRKDNLEIRRACLTSPAELLERARIAGIVPETDAR